MAIIMRPTIAGFEDVSLLKSQYFINAGQRIIKLKIRAHKGVEIDSDEENYILPHGVSDGKHRHTYREKINIQKEIKFTAPNINVINGLEILNAHLVRKHPRRVFYILELITETISPPIPRHTLRWKRGPAATVSGIISLHLIQIDGKNVVEHFSEGEMFSIAGRLSDDRCRLSVETGITTRVLCTPILD